MNTLDPPQYLSVRGAMALYKRNRSDLLAVIRTYRDMHGKESVKVRRRGNAIQSFSLSMALHEELRRRR